MKNSKYTLLMIGAMLTGALKSQDVHFSQVFETPVFLSPANAGFFNGYVRATANYRNQWASMNKAFQTMAVSVDGGLFKSKKRPAFMGVGLTVFNDQAGVARISKTTALLNLSGIVKLNRNSALSVGLAGGTSSHNGQYNRLTYESQFNGNTLEPATISGEVPYRQFTTVDVSAGIAYEFTSVKTDQDHDDITSFRIAIGAHHLNRPAQEYGFGSSYRLPVRYVYAITSVLDIEDTRWTLTPAIVYQTQGDHVLYNRYNMLFMGSFVKYRMSTGTKVTGAKTQNAIGFGLFYRNKDAIVPKLIFDLGDYSIGMAYDVNVSGYRSASRGMGGFEISLRYNNLASSLFESRREFR